MTPDSDGRFVTIDELAKMALRFPCVAVTGPERSGTTITTEMVSSSTGYTDVEEEAWDNDFGALWEILRERREIVVHAPHLTFRVHEIDRHCPERVLVVFVHRAVDDIVASQRNADWGLRSGHCPNGGDPKGWGNPASRWYDRQSYEMFREEIDPEAHLCLNRQRVWRRQKRLVRNYVEIEYEGLRSHPLWLEPGARR
jgi:hypothetical protein